MPQPRKPQKILELTGALKTHADRRRQEPTPSAPLGPPPAHLDEATRATWDEIAASVCPGVLMNSDRIALELAACLLAEFRQDPSGFMAAKLTNLRAILGTLGMTPADRSRVSAPPDSKNKVDPWAGFKKP